MLKRHEKGRFHVVSTWNTRVVFAGKLQCCLDVHHLSLRILKAGALGFQSHTYSKNFKSLRINFAEELGFVYEWQ